MLCRTRVWYCFCNSRGVLGGSAFGMVSRMGQTSFEDSWVELRGKRMWSEYSIESSGKSLYSIKIQQVIFWNWTVLWTGLWIVLWTGLWIVIKSADLYCSPEAINSNGSEQLDNAADYDVVVCCSKTGFPSTAAPWEFTGAVSDH